MFDVLYSTAHWAAFWLS